MAAPRRVVVTGIGTVNALGAGGATALAALLDSGRSAIGPVTSFDASGSASHLAAEIDESALADLVDAEAARRLSRICRLAVAASSRAVADSGLDAGDGTRLGVVIGTEHGDFRSSEAFAAGFLRRGIGGLSPMIFPNTVMNSMGAVAAIALGARGPTITVNQATIAGDLAVARGMALVAGGRADAVVAGGVDELWATVYHRLAEMRVLSPMGGPSPEGCRPYAADHNGPVIGEGATFVVLEERSAALARGATVQAEILGARWSAIPAAPHTAPSKRRDPGSPVARVLGEAGLAGAVDLCYGSGNGDPGVDDWEVALLRADLPRAPGAPRSLAPFFGQHGGLGALRVAAAALGLAARASHALVHGIARGGCRMAILLGRAA